METEQDGNPLNNRFDDELFCEYMNLAIAKYHDLSVSHYQLFASAFGIGK